MIKRMGLLRRREGMDVSDFRRHWSGRHAQLALSMPGVVKYTQNRVDRVLWEKAEGDSFQLDGVVELFFANNDSMAAAQASEIGRRLIPEDELLFLSGWTLCIVDTEGPHDYDGAAKVIVAAVRAPGVCNADFSAILSSVSADSRSGVRKLAFNWTKRVASRPALWHEPKEPQVLAVLWFEDSAAARTEFAAGSPLTTALENVSIKSGAYAVDALTIK
jgi:uncharacterized protein (TIGR02118 family)